MTEIANFTDRYRQEVSIDKLNNGKYCITVDGRMTQKDLSADNLIAWFTNASHTNPKAATRDELVEVLRTTRALVAVASASGFTNKDDLNKLYANQAEITKVVPLRPTDRETIEQAMAEKLG